MSNCDKKCVQTLIEKAKKEFTGADFWIPSGARNMCNFDTGARYTGWPGLRFRYPAKKKDGTPAKGKFETGHFALEYCPICGGKL